MRGASRRVLLAALAGGLLIPAGASAATSSEDAVRLLNLQRARNGLPADLVSSPSLATGCANHNAYMARNGEFAHGEDPERPGWTPEGAMTAPGSSGAENLASGGGLTWDEHWSNPWSDAPIHLLSIFSPEVTAAGYAQSGRYACLRLSGSRDLPNAVYSLPGPGATDVPLATYSESELPYSPADFAGYPDVTGYNILLWRKGGYPDVQATTLEAGGSTVEVRAVDSWSTAPDGERFSGGGAVIVPAKPLSPSTTYRLAVTFTDGTEYRVEFTTETPTEVPTAVLPKRAKHGAKLQVPLRGVASGQTVTLTWRVAGRKVKSKYLVAESKVRARAPKRAGLYTLEVRVGSVLLGSRQVRVS